MKKLLCLIALLLALVLALTSCGVTPTIEISEDGYWVINGEKTDVLAKGEKGEKGEDGEDASSVDENPQGLAFFLKDDGTYVVESGGAKLLSEITIPSTYKGRAVTEIACFNPSRFQRCTDAWYDSVLKKVTIPVGVTAIADSTFDECEMLESITIPNSVESIGESAFCCCSALTDIYYTGSEAEWSLIEIASSNEALTSATIHYNYIPE